MSGPAKLTVVHSFYGLKLGVASFAVMSLLLNLGWLSDEKNWITVRIEVNSVVNHKLARLLQKGLYVVLTFGSFFYLFFVLSVSLLESQVKEIIGDKQIGQLGHFIARILGNSADHACAKKVLRSL